MIPSADLVSEAFVVRVLMASITERRIVERVHPERSENSLRLPGTFPASGLGSNGPGKGNCREALPGAGSFRPFGMAVSLHIGCQQCYIEFAIN